MLDGFLTIADAVLGWLLLLPRPMPVVALAALSALAMVLLRRLVTDQQQLSRCAADKKRLRHLIRQARRRGDKSAARRHKATRSLVQLKLLKAEGWPLLLSIPVIGFLGTWAYYRLEFLPPDAGETVRVELSLPASAEGTLVTLVPEAGLDADRWIGRAVEGQGSPSHSVVRWQVKAQARPEPYRLQMRYRDRTFVHPLLVGQETYAPAVRQHEQGLLLPQSAVYMQPAKVLGVLPWLSPTSMVGAILPAWLVTYVLVVVPLVYLLKAVLRIH